MAIYHVKCISAPVGGELWTVGGYYMVTDNGFTAENGTNFRGYILTSGENTVEAINRWFEECGSAYRFELATANEKVDEPKDTVTLNWTKHRCHNVAEFLELYFFQNIRDDEDMDSMWYLHDMLHAIEELNEFGKET